MSATQGRLQFSCWLKGLLLVLIALVPASLSAATINGTVKDSSGAVLVPRLRSPAKTLLSLSWLCQAHWENSRSLI